MEAEIRRLAHRTGMTVPDPERPADGILWFPFDPALARLLVTYARTPSRVLWEQARLSSRRLEPLYEELGERLVADPPLWLRQDGLGVSVRVGPMRDPFAGPLQIRGTVKNAVIDAARELGVALRLEPERPDVELVVNEVSDPPSLLVSIDLAGRGQHERGYRLSRTEAPVRETLAAQALVLARWHPRHEVLFDPMGGSGTFVIEGALLALGRKLWVPPKEPALYAIDPFRSQSREAPDLFEETRPAIFYGDKHTPAIDAARDNARRAGVFERLVFLHADARSLDRDRLEQAARKTHPASFPDPLDLERGLIIANPPYGPRLGSSEAIVREAHEALADLWHRLGRGWRVVILSGFEGTESVFGTKSKMRRPVRAGKLHAHVYLFEHGDRAPRSHTER